MDVYTKERVTCVKTLASYTDDSVKQVCYRPISKTVEIYRAAPDVKYGTRFLRNAKFSIDWNELNDDIEKLDSLQDPLAVMILIATSHDKRLIFRRNETYGNRDMGYEMRSSVHKRTPLLVDLDEEDLDAEKLLPEKHQCEMELIYDPMGNNCLHFKRSNDFEEIKTRLIEFRRKVCEEYPKLRHSRPADADETTAKGLEHSWTD